MVCECDTDDEFFQWIAAHLDDGFFVGSAPGYPTFLHRASCGQATTPKRQHYVGGEFGMRKHVSTDRQALEARFPVGLNYCKHCRPHDDGS